MLYHTEMYIFTKYRNLIDINVKSKGLSSSINESSTFYAKLVGKDEIEYSVDWNDRVLLPSNSSSSSSSDFVNIDKMEYRFSYVANEAEQCQNGCGLYLAIEDYDKKETNKTSHYQWSTQFKSFQT